MKAVTVAHKNNRVWVLTSAIAVIICFALMQIRSANAQTATGSADPVKKYSITFPVSTLGNCASLEECKAYCEDETHKEACTNFAKSKGFYKAPEGQGNARSRLVLEKAKAELGCNNDTECKAFCKEEANKEKCKDFAKKYKLEAQKKGLNSEILEKAKTTLGCNSEESCKTLCQKEENKEKCAAFAKANHLGGGSVKLNASAEMEKIKQIIEQCKTNPQGCRENIATIEAELNKRSNEFCKGKPDKCRQMLKDVKEASRGGKFTPNSEKAYENANAEHAKFCRENPEKCKNASGSGSLIPLKTLPLVKPQVQGVSRVPSFFDWLFNVFLK